MSINGSAPFQIKQIIGSPLKHKVMTSLPLPEKILGLKPLEEQSPELFNKIMQCLKQIYSYVTDRAYIEDTVTFFHHAGSSALYEKHYRLKINEKDHGKKLGVVFSLIKKTLSEVETALKIPELNLHHDLLQDFQAELIWHNNICISIIPTLNDDIKAHLKQHCHIDSDTITPILTSPRKRLRVQMMHPCTPPSEKNVPFIERKSPKKMSRQDIISEHVLRNNGVIMQPQLDTAPTPAKPKPNAKAMLIMLPRSIRIKKQPAATPKGIENSEINRPKI